MDPWKPKVNPQKGPEYFIQEAIEKYLREREWFVMATHGNQFQSGFPDIYATHQRWGPRWIEVKNPVQFSFTPAQIKKFPQLSAHGTSIWILGAGTLEEYDKLFKPQNWMEWFTCYQAGKTNMTAWRGGRV